MIVTLSGAEFLSAWTQAGIRRCHSLARDLKDAHGYSPDAPADDEIAACIAELAVAKVTGKHWHLGVGRYHEPDVGPYHVRCVRRPGDSLIFRQADPDGVFFLAYWPGRLSVSVVGFIQSRDARRPEWWKAPNGRPGAWFVPQSALTRPEEVAA